MNNKYNNTFTFLIFILFINILTAQTFVGELHLNDKNQTQLLIFKDGTTEVGRIISIQNTQVLFLEKTNNDTLQFELFEIDKIVVQQDDLDVTTPEGLAKAEQKEQTKFLTTPVVSTNHRLFYSETGFTLPKQTLEYRTIWGTIHTLDYGIGKGFTVGTGFTTAGHIILHTKFNILQNIRRDRFRAGFDIKVIGKPLFTNDAINNKELQWSGFLQTSFYTSLGTPDRMVHLSFNVIPIAGQDFDGNLVIFYTFGGAIKIAPHWKIIYENSFGALIDFRSDIVGVFSGFGANWFNEKNSIHIAIQSDPLFGFFNFPANETILTTRLPFLSYSRFF